MLRIQGRKAEVIMQSRESRFFGMKASLRRIETSE